MLPMRRNFSPDTQTTSNEIPDDSITTNNNNDIHKYILSDLLEPLDDGRGEGGSEGNGGGVGTTSTCTSTPSSSISNTSPYYCPMPSPPTSQDVLTALLANTYKDGGFFCVFCKIPLPSVSNIDDAVCDTCKHNRQFKRIDAEKKPLEDEIDFRSLEISTNAKSPKLDYCFRHFNSKQLYCDTCKAAVCESCTRTQEHQSHTIIGIYDAISRAYTSSQSILADARRGQQIIKDTLEKNQYYAETLDSQKSRALHEVLNNKLRFIAAIEQRSNELQKKIKLHCELKNIALTLKADHLRSVLSRLAKTSDMLVDAMENCTPADLLMKNEMAAMEIRVCKTVRIEFNDQERNNHIIFSPPDYTLLQAVSQMGSLRMAPLLPPSLQTPNHLSLMNQTTVVGRPIYQMFQPVVLSQTTQTPLIFGGEGDKSGELCRPWGICCDHEGNFLVADRSNNRIQVFNPQGEFLFMFGSHGNKFGEFDRPAGICCDAIGRIVVVDKDNHRVQIFMPDGTFITMFGEKGVAQGQFCYPWDVSSNSLAQLVVSDTRNHRVQMFTSNGDFLAVFGYGPAVNPIEYKHFDSPRGVSFMPDGKIMTTDFNNHRVVTIDPTTNTISHFGCEGTGDRQFSRPQGIVCDDNGNIVICDSKNNRIQVFNQTGMFLYKICSGMSSGRLALDRPGGICLTPNGRIAVVDFGHNRIVVF